MIISADYGLYRFSTNEELFPGLNPNEPSWFAWNVLMKFYDGIKLDKKESAFFYKITGGLTQDRTEEIPPNWCILAGAGGGKTRFISRVSPYRAMIFDQPLHPGQIAENIIIAPSIPTGMIGFEYIEALLEGNKSLYRELVPEHTGQKPIIKNSQMARMRFSNGSSVRLSPVARISGRGRSIWTLILEEAAHFKTEGRFSDEEIYRSAGPRMGRFGVKSMCFAITTPMDKTGLIWKIFNKYFGVKNQLWLVVRGSTKDFNPTVSDKFLQRKQEEDPDTFRREYLAEFLESLYGAFSTESIENCTINGRTQLPFSGHHHFGFIDPSSLSQQGSVKFNDEFVAGIGHIDGGSIVIDLIKAWSAKDNITPDDATAKAIELFRRYRVRDVCGDKFDNVTGYIEHKFTGTEFKFERCKLTKSDLYLEMIPLLNDGRIELLDDEVLINQLKTLERKRGHYGRDTIQHLRDKHDDRANVVAGLVHMGKERLTIHPSRLSEVITSKSSSAAHDVFGDERPITDWSGM